MKKNFIFVALALAIFLCNVVLAADSREGTSPRPEGYVIVYYFHGNFRCPTCLRIEQYAREVVEENFKEEVSSGKVVFKAVNMDEKPNGHFIRDYQLYTKSLIISLIKGGKEQKHENLTKIWEYARNKDRFFEYVTANIEDYLKEAQ